MKVIVTDKLAEDGIKFLIEQGHEVDKKFGISHEDLLEIIENYDAIIVRSATKVRKDVLERAKNLKVVGRAGNGIDNIDVGECTKRGIAVVNTPEGNIMAAAELTVGLIFSVFRNIPQAHMAAKNKDYRRNKFVGRELDGKTAGIIGLGRIGSIVASKLRGCNMRVVAYDPYITDERLRKLGIEKCDTINELLKQSDLVTVHIPKSAESKGLIGEKELKICKQGVTIVNVARGGIIDEKALYNAVKEGKVAAAALDVLESEPNFNKKPEEQDYCNPLLELDNVVYTPHLGASTNEANFNVSYDVARLINGVLNGEMVSAVNMPPINRDSLKDMRPYVELAGILGSIYYKAETEAVKKVEIICSGELAEHDTSVVALSALKGLLESNTDDKVNYINAELIANSMGIEIIESKTKNLDKYSNLITVKFITDSRELSVSGTVFGKGQIRIVDFFGYKLDFEPTPHVVAVQNVDKPGVIGQIGSVLGAGGINIAAMQWSRNRKGEKAEAFLSVDGEVNNSVLELLRNIDGVLRVSKFNF